MTKQHQFNARHSFVLAFAIGCGAALAQPASAATLEASNCVKASVLSCGGCPGGLPRTVPVGQRVETSKVACVAGDKDFYLGATRKAFCVITETFSSSQTSECVDMGTTCDNQVIGINTCKNTGFTATATSGLGVIGSNYGVIANAPVEVLLSRSINCSDCRHIPAALPPVVVPAAAVNSLPVGGP